MRLDSYLMQFLVKKGFNVSTLRLLNQCNLEKLAMEQGFYGQKAE